MTTMDHIEHTNCPLCGTYSEVHINMHDYMAWRNGAPIQDAMPYLSAGDRELLKTGICTPCWDRSFGGDV